MSQANRFLFICLLIGMVCIGCAEEGDLTGEVAEIPDSARVIVFDGGAEGPVNFSHETHSTDYYEGVCLFCHDHESVNTDTHWSCRDCHAAGQDREDLCDEYDQDHGCIMAQCQNCHVLEGSPAPDGLSCGVVNGGCHN
jgi:hypothetical protein